MGISLIGRHVATEQSGPPRNQVRFSNSSCLMEILELRMSMLFEGASNDNDENASYIEEKNDVDEREYDPASILQPCLMKMHVMIIMKMLAILRKRMTFMKENMIRLLFCNLV